MNFLSILIYIYQMNVRQTASQYKGVTYHKGAGKWQSTLAYNGKKEHLGLFKDELDAAKAYENRYKEVKHLITNKTYNTNHYVDERKLRYEMLVSLNQGRLTRKMTEYIVLIVKRTHLKFRYKDLDDKYDCYSYALEAVLTRWYNYDEDKYILVLPYITEIAKRAFAFHWNTISKHMKHISIEGTYENGRAINI